MIAEPMQRGQQWLKTLLHISGVNADITGGIETTQGHDGAFKELDNYWLTIDESNLTAEQIRVLIGGDGSVLDAIQYLANSVLNLNQSEDQQASYTIELNGYRVKRQAEIRALAEAAAQEARATGREVEIKSLSSAERREIHTFFQDFSDLETYSRGKEPHRLLVVRPARLE